MTPPSTEATGGEQATAMTLLHEIVRTGQVADELECSCYESAPCDACQLQAAIHQAYHFLATEPRTTEGESRG